MDSITKRWELIEKNTTIPFDEFISTINFILSSTYFTFNHVIYKQTFGTPMGSPLSPIIADIVMQDLERKALDSINLKLPLYYRYVDDIILAAPSNKITDILNTFNSFHNRLQFTIEYEHNRCLSFLDLKLNIINNNIIIDWFQKQTFSGRFLSFFSKHPMCHKIGTIYNLVDRALLLSHPSFHQKNLELIVNILRNNSYPIDIIFKYINLRIEKLLNTKLAFNSTKLINNDQNGGEKKEIKFFVLPYIHNITERAATIIRDTTNFRVGFRCCNKLDTFVKTHKDATEIMSKTNIVYKIYCKDCDVSYVGQTKRQIGTRIKEHKNNIKLDETRHSVITDHIENHKHTFDWNNVRIMDSESNYNKRIISEMLHIKEQRKGINLQKDTELLDESYFYLLDILSR